MKKAKKESMLQNPRIRVMIVVVIGGTILTLAKFVAYYLTSSTAILSDALESIINILTSCFALFSVYYAAKPKDKDHPYGHGKIEYFAAGIEGTLIFAAGLLIIYQAIYTYFYPQEITQLDIGVWIIAISGALNYILGRYLVNRGEKYNSLSLKSDGQHLMSDTYTSLGLTVGLLVIYFTGIYWIDKVLALLMAAIIMRMGYKLIRTGLAGLMDEQDKKTLEEIVSLLNKNRKTHWIDFHNMRIQKYGASLHIDCHLTLPWYESLKDVHKETVNIHDLINEQTKHHVEFSIHIDPCKPSSCPVCQIADCPVRQKDFQKAVEWDINTLTANKMHDTVEISSERQDLT